MKFKIGDIVKDKDGHIGVILVVDYSFRKEPNIKVIWVDYDGKLLHGFSLWYFGVDLKPYQLEDISKKNAIVLALGFDVEFENFEIKEDELTHNGGFYPIECVKLLSIGYNTKQVKTTKTITIEISEDSFNKLKESLLEGK